MIRKPKYFIANFGEKDSSTYPVDGECYPVPTKYSDTKMISEGDVMLLCCWAGHKNLHKGDAWGLGKVTDKKERGGLGCTLPSFNSTSPPPSLRFKPLKCFQFHYGGVLGN